MTGSIQMTLAEVEQLSTEALIRSGALPAAATSLARAIAAAERDGISSHGVAYLPVYCEHLRCGKVSGQAQPSVERSAPSVVVVDARSGFAHPAIDGGFAELIPLARTQGIATLVVRNSYNCGVLGYHTEALADAGLVGLGFTNAPASIAASGGRTPVLGTNPWSIAVPGDNGAVIVIDQSASVVAKSEVMKRMRRGESVPEGWVLGPDGQPTTDASIGLKGTMVPAGGYKGVGSALLVEIMAACLSGATLGIHASPFSGPAGGPPRTGQAFIAIAPELTSGGMFAERISNLVTALGREEGAHIPGAGRRAARARTMVSGVKIDKGLYDTVQALLK